jgi:predicted phage terminase large subunit-like protein
VFPAYAALWPTRYSRQKLDEIRATVSPYFWNAQYQAVPSMGDLAFFDPTKMQRYVHQNCEQVWIALDANQKETAHGSYAALVCLGSLQGLLKVLGVRRGRWSQPDLHNNVRDFYRSMAQFTGILPEAVVVEDAAAGRGVIDFLGNQLPIVVVQPRGTKEDRAGAVCHLNNQIALPEHAAWLSAFENELQNFPLCADKDQVDALVHALAYASRPAEFKQKVIEGCAEYDCLDEGNYQSSFASENAFDSRLLEAEHSLRRSNQ